MPESPIRALFAARLVQARQMRGLSQRALGDRMGLGKEKGSSRINRYEHQVTAVGFSNLEKLAEVLEVPVAYLLAESAPMADAILAIASAGPRQQANLAQALRVLADEPAVVKALLKVLQSSVKDRNALKSALQSLGGGSGD